jgi:hypothetical protein
MNDFDFYLYLIKCKTPQKVSSDIVSRLKRIEKSIFDCDIEEEYYKDKCETLLRMFSNKGENEELKKALIGSLPIGNYAMNTFKYAIRKYVVYMDWFTTIPKNHKREAKSLSLKN